MKKEEKKEKPDIIKKRMMVFDWLWDLETQRTVLGYLRGRKIKKGLKGKTTQR